MKIEFTRGVIHAAPLAIHSIAIGVAEARDLDPEHAITQVGPDSDNRPSLTRNPANGFLSWRREFVVAMGDAGRLRWGAADFGARSSGDSHHFHLGE